MADIAVLGLRVDASGAIVATEQFARKLERLDGSAKRSTESLGGVATRLATIGVSSAALVAVVRRVVDLSDTYSELHARLKLVTTSSAQLDQVQSALFASAQRNRQAFSSVADLYARLARTGKDLGLSQQQLLQFTEGVNQALVVSGTSGAQASGSLLQLSQALGGGIVRAEEFNSVLEGTPRILQAVAANYGATGMSIAQLRNLVNAGKVSSADFAAAFLKGTADIKREAATIPPTVGGAFTQLNNALLLFVGQANTASGVSVTLAGGLKTLADNVGTLVQAAGALAVVFGARFLGGAASGIAATIAALVKARAETVAYATEAVHVAKANEAAAAAEVAATNERRAHTAATLQAVEAERALQLVTLQGANAQKTKAATQLAQPGLASLGGAVVAREQDTLAAANKLVSASTAELSVLGQQQARINREIAVTSGVLAEKSIVQAGTTAALSVAEATLAKTTSFTAVAMERAAIVARGFWAAIGGPIGAVLLGLYAVYSVLKSVEADALAKLKTRTDAVAAANDKFATSLQGMGLDALKAAEAQERLNLAQAKAKENESGGALKTAKQIANNTNPDVGGSRTLEKSLSEVNRLQVEFDKNQDAARVSAGNLNAIIAARVPVTKAAQAQDAQTAKEFKEAETAASEALSRQLELNAAAGQSGAILDDINAKYDLRAKLGGIDAKFTTQQVSALKALAAASDVAAKNARDLAAAEQVRATQNSADERVTAAQQELALSKMIGAEAAVQAVRNDADNARTRARIDLKGREVELAITLKSIAEAEAAGVATVLVTRAKELSTANEARVRTAKQALDLVGLEGLALANAQIEQQAGNELAEVRSRLKGEELALAEQSIQAARDYNVATATGNEVLAQREAQQDKLNDRAKKLLADQIAQAKAFKDSFTNTLSSGLVDVIEHGQAGFKNFTENVKHMFVKMFSDILAASAFKKLSGSLAAFIPGGANGNAGGGVGLGASRLGVASVGFLTGYGVGGAIGGTNKTVGAITGGISGALSGLGTGAAIGAAGGPIGAVGGAIIGAVAGIIGGFLSSANKGKQAAAQMAIAQDQLGKSLDAIRASFSNDALGTAIENAKAQFDELRKSTQSAYAGTKNEPERNKVLAELNKLEAQRIAILQAEYAEQQKRAQDDLQIRRLVAAGDEAGATAKAFAAAQEREYKDAVKGGADATTLAVLAQTQLEEATKRAADAAKQEAAIKEQNRRELFDVQNQTRTLTDPRGAAQAQAIEDANNRIFDAIAAGASEAQLAALALYNTAVLAKAEAQQLEEDTRTRESLTARALQATGNTRGAEDVTQTAQQRQELVDAIEQGMSPGNLALLKFTQLAERQQTLMLRALEDGTKAIQAQTKLELDAKDAQIAAIEKASDAQIKAIDRQIENEQVRAKLEARAFDEQIAAVRAGAKAQTEAIDITIESQRNALDSYNKQASALEKQFETNTKIVETLNGLRDSLKLGDNSTFSPEDKLAEARRQFEVIAKAAQGGDSTAANNLPGAANALLEASRKFNGSTSGYNTDFEQVQSVLAAVADKFGASLPIDQQQLEQAKAQVELLQYSIDSLGKQKDAINTTAEKNIAIIQAAKDKAAEDSQKLLDLLAKQKEKISADATAQINAINEEKQAIQDASDKQIEQLKNVLQETLLARLKQDEYWQTFLGISGGTDQQTGGPTPGNAAGNVQGAGQVTVPFQQLNETKRAAAANEAELKLLREVLERVVSVAVAGSDAEVDATKTVAAAVSDLVNQTRLNAQGAAVRTVPVRTTGRN